MNYTNKVLYGCFFGVQLVSLETDSRSLYPPIRGGPCLGPWTNNRSCPFAVIAGSLTFPHDIKRRCQDAILIYKGFHCSDAIWVIGLLVPSFLAGSRPSQRRTRRIDFMLGQAPTTQIGMQGDCT